MKKLVDKQNLILILILALCCVRLVYMFNLRLTHHIDEVYSYGFANSNGVAFFLNPRDNDSLNEHLRKWIDGEELKSYLVCDSEERFDFKNVINNKLQDNCPPNYELMVHFICSLFPDSFSWAYPFTVNLVFFIASMIVLYLIALCLFSEFRSKYFYSISCLIFFALSVCGTGAYLYMRMYGVMCFYGLLMLFSILKLIDDKHTKKEDFLYIILLFISSFFGLYTHTIFIVFAFWLTAFSCLYLFCKRRVKDSLKYGLSVLSSVGAYYLCFRVPSEQVGTWMTDINGDGYSVFTRLTFSNRWMGIYNLGFYIPFTYANIIAFMGGATFVLIVCFLVSFLLRKEKWFISIKKDHIYIESVKKIWKRLYEKPGILKGSLPIMFFTIIGYEITISFLCPIVTQGVYSLRYLFIGGFLLIILFVSFCFSLSELFEKEKIGHIYELCICGVFIGLLLFQNIGESNPFIFADPYTSDEKVRELTRGSDVMVFGHNPQQLNCFIVPLRDCNRFYYGIYSDLEETITDIPDGPFYFLVYKGCFVEEDSLYPLNDGIRRQGTIEDFIYDILEKNDKTCNVNYIEDYVSMAGDFAVYIIEPSM